MGKPVVTANTALLAHHGTELFAAAKERGVPMYGEASVCGGIPILKTLRESLAADEITSLAGIINSAANTVLTRMDEDHISQLEAMRIASECGYTHADPAFDVDGIDAKHKLEILAAHLCGGDYPQGEILREGIAEIGEKDFFYARKRNMTIKHLAIAERSASGIGLRVHPVLLSRIHPLASVRDHFNAVLLHGDAVGEVMLQGQGVGALPSASAVLADIVDIATRTVRADLPKSLPHTRMTPVHSQDEIESAYYLRTTVEDKPGILGDIATIVGRQGISVSLASAELIPNADGLGDIEITVHKTREKLIRDAIADIDRLPGVRGKTRLLRIAEAPWSSIRRNAAPL
jgi:homoserine dehydrogenase